MGSWDLIYHVLRANFDGTSSDYLSSAEDKGSATYEYGCNVSNIHINDDDEGGGGGGGVTVKYTDRDKKERTRTSDRVFAADGPSSTIRGILLPDIKRTYAGYVTPRTHDTRDFVGLLITGCLERNGGGDIGFGGDEKGVC